VSRLAQQRLAQQELLQSRIVAKDSTGCGGHTLPTGFKCLEDQPSAPLMQRTADGLLVLRLTSFDDEDPSMQSARAAIKLQAQSAQTKLLVDLRGNGGGSVALGAGLMGVLSQGLRNVTNENRKRIFGQYNMRATAYTAWKLFSSISGGIISVVDSSGELVTCSLDKNNDNQIIPATCGERFMNASKSGFRTFTQYSGGTESFNFGKYALVLDDYYSQATMEANNQIGPGFSRDNIALITDGVCGSTCAVFIKNFQENNLAKIVSVGGLAFQAMSTASFVGGSVASFDGLAGSYSEIAGIAKVLGLEWTEPPVWPYSGSYQFTLQQRFSALRPAVPLQWTQMVADSNIPMWLTSDETTASSLAELYAQATDDCRMN